jgi:hypothetical protein
MRIKKFFKNLEKKEHEFLETLDSDLSLRLFIFNFIVLVFIKYIIRFGKLIFPADKNEFDDIRY